jgi:hypothetical protein
MMPSVNDPRHAAVIHEAQLLFRQGGWLLADAGYEHVYTGEFRTALSRCDDISAHLIRTRADRIALHAESGRVVWYDAKTTAWTRGQDFPIETLPFLKACCDAKTFGIEYLFCCRRRDGAEYGLIAGSEAAQLIQRIKVPEWRRDGDMDRWSTAFQPMLDLLGCGCKISYGDCSRGGGDPFAAIAIDSVEMPTWQQVIETWNASIQGKEPKTG